MSGRSMRSMTTGPSRLDGEEHGTSAPRSSADTPMIRRVTPAGASISSDVRLRPLHTGLRPDRQPAHRASPPAQPMAPRWPTKRRRRRESRPSYVRATVGLNGTQLDLKPPPRSGYTPVTRGNIDREVSPHGSLPRTGDPGHPFSHEPLTRPDLAHHWPTATGNGLPNRSRTRCRPGLREHRHRA
jgi:hypothetical protein